MSEDMVPRFVVVGDPIEHSLSPQIHQAFAEQLGIKLEYSKVRVPVDQFAAFFDDFWANGGCGANVTVPLKSEAFAYADSLDGLAQQARAVNTLARRNDQVVGFNTDGIGLCRDLTHRHGVELKQAEVLMLGAGGAVQGVIEPLLEEGVQKIVIANRTVSKAQILAAEFGTTNQISGCGFADIGNYLDGPDLIINATSFALSDGAVEVPIGAQWLEQAFCYDMSYADKAVFARWAQQNGAKASVDGLGMLVEQAAVSFEIWHGEAPATDPVIERLYGLLA